MNYDFSEKEQAFFTVIEECVTGFAEKAGPQYPDLAVVDKDLRLALPKLAASGYTQIGCGAGDNATQTLVAAMETVAAAAPSIFLGVEMSCRMFGRLLDTWASAPKLKDDVLAQIRAGQALREVNIRCWYLLPL